MQAVWAVRYIGIPFADHGRDPAIGLDCWGLLRTVYQNEFRIDLPSLDEAYLSSTDRATVAAVIEQTRAAWRPIPPEATHFGDVALIRIGRHPLHVGVVAEVAPVSVLHVEWRIDTVLERISSPSLARRLCGFYRYGGLP
jgi:cell wall-associated NlpC family hydrolase